MKHKLSIPVLFFVAIGLLVGAVFLVSTHRPDLDTISVSGHDDLQSTATISEPPLISIPAMPEDVTPSAGTGAEKNRLGAQSQKTAVVIDVSKPICGGALVNNFECYEKHYENLVTQSSITSAFADLKARYPENAYIRSQCHPLTHIIGRTAARKFDTVGEAYTQGDGYCWSGYYHGVLETFISAIGLANLPQKMDSICADIPSKERYGFDYYNCVHGLGHGVMAVTNTELFQSLDYCDNLSGTWEQHSCASGAYMENVIVDGLNHTTKYLRPSEPLYPCNESPEKYKNTCYLMQTSYMLKVNGGDFKQTFAWCKEAGNYAATCYQSLGRDASGRSTSNVASTKATCLIGEDYIQQLNCVIGAVKDFISYFHSDVQGKALCVSFENEELKNVCLSTGESYYRLL